MTTKEIKYGNTTTGKSFWRDFSLHCLVFQNTSHSGSMLTFQGLYLLEKTLSLKIIKPFGLQQIPGKFPTELTAPGMPRERSRYLYAKVRPYIRPWCQDKLCPPTQAEE